MRNPQKISEKRVGKRQVGDKWGQVGVLGTSGTRRRGSSDLIGTSGTRMKETIDSVDSTASFGLKTIHLCSNFW